IAPGIGVFPYLIALSRLPTSGEPNLWLFLLSLLGNLAVAVMLVIMSYTVAYFGVLTPDRVVRYRMVRFLMRGPLVAIFAILAMQTAPTLARLLGLPSDVVTFSLVTGVIIFSQLFLSVSKSLVDRLIYREDRDEVAWLRELDRHLLTTTDLRQFLENHLAVLCELLRVESGFVAAVVGADLMLEATVGPAQARNKVEASDWSELLSHTLSEYAAAEAPSGPSSLALRALAPHSEGGYWLWLLQEWAPDGERLLTLGMIGVQARTEAPLLTEEELQVIERMIERMSSALMDRRLQQSVFVTLKQLIPDIERIQSMRNVVPYSEAESATTTASVILDDSPANSPEFEAWVKDALSHYWGGPKLSESPLLGLRTVTSLMDRSDAEPTKALRLVLGSALERLKPETKQNFTAPEWLLYNILEMRFIQGRKVREIADRLAMSESDLYRKQRVAIGHLARVLSEMEAANGAAHMPESVQTDLAGPAADLHGAPAPM
ncbi:MAG: histidine kinase N-terminal 7TM domain-containing protein, partial [Caldilineaceae bacterium]